MPDVPAKRVLLAKLSPYYDALRSPRLFDSVDRFCVFIGHGRSGSTLVGALLNAHPEVVLSNELDVLDYLGIASNRRELFGLIYHMSQRQVRQGSPGGGGYFYAVPNQWQGMHRAIRVIGDRRAGSTAIQAFRDPGLVDRLRELVDLPLVFVAPLRNPYDTIATTVQKTRRLDGEQLASHLDRQITHFFERCQGIQRVQERLGPGGVHFVRHECLLEQPRRVLADLCDALNLEADSDYLADCAGVLRREPHVTRNSIDWDAGALERVEREIRATPWLSGYSFAA